ncbi:MAG: hypothetical protein D6681_12790 [Calditrichaeota bacterium]|nr:MAG: hypothetical protein D6681_12790 [Calditrichota bacterium]
MPFGCGTPDYTDFWGIMEDITPIPPSLLFPFSAVGVTEKGPTPGAVMKLFRVSLGQRSQKPGWENDTLSTFADKKRRILTVRNLPKSESGSAGHRGNRRSFRFFQGFRRIFPGEICQKRG